jgi:hypothetical protein
VNKKEKYIKYNKREETEYQSPAIWFVSFHYLISNANSFDDTSIIQIFIRILLPYQVCPSSLSLLDPIYYFVMNRCPRSLRGIYPNHIKWYYTSFSTAIISNLFCMSLFRTWSPLCDNKSIVTCASHYFFGISPFNMLTFCSIRYDRLITFL